WTQSANGQLSWPASPRACPCDVVERRIAAPTLPCVPSQDGCRASLADLCCPEHDAASRMWSECSIMQHQLYGVVAPSLRSGERRGERRAVRSPLGAASVIPRPPG